MAAAEKIKVVSITSKHELLWLNFLFMVKHPLCAALTLYYIVRNSYNVKLFYYKFMNCFLHRNAQYEKARRYPQSVIVEGHWQNVIAIFERPESERTIASFARHFPPTHVLFLEGTEASRHERMITRGHGVREHLPSERVARWEQSALHNSTLAKKIILKWQVGEYIATDGTQESVVDSALSIVRNITPKAL